MLAYASPPELAIVAVLALAVVGMLIYGIRSGPPPASFHRADRDPIAHVRPCPAPPYDWEAAGEWNPFHWPLDFRLPEDFFVRSSTGRPYVTVRDLVEDGCVPDDRDPAGLTIVRRPELAR